jgi:hypothetical protein
VNLAALGAEGAAEVQVLAAAAGGVAFAEADFQAGIEEAPGFAVFLEDGAGLAAGVGVEADTFAASDGLDGDDVPDVFRDDPSILLGIDYGDEEVDFFAGIDLAVGSGGFNAIAIFGAESGRFDLDAEKPVVEFDDGVVAVAVSPGGEDGETEMGGASEESGFGGFSATLAGGLGYGLDSDGFNVREWLDQDWVLLRIVEVLLHIRVRHSQLWMQGTLQKHKWRRIEACAVWNESQFKINSKVKSLGQECPSHCFCYIFIISLCRG